MKKRNRLPPGWNQPRVQRVLKHYESQSDIEAVAEDEAAYRSTTPTACWSGRAGSRKALPDRRGERARGERM